MVECGANEVPEDVMVAALELGHKSIQPLIELQLKMRAELGKPKREVTLFVPSDEIKKKVFDRVSGAMNELLDKPLSKNEFYSGMKAIKTEAETELCVVPEGGNPANYMPVNMFRESFEQAEMDVCANASSAWANVPMGATPTDIRPIWCEVAISPRAHGSGLFTRGETQILSVCNTGYIGRGAGTR
jgi:polyribonucleotide nucleotidyltransferase